MRQSGNDNPLPVQAPIDTDAGYVAARTPVRPTILLPEADDIIGIDRIDVDKRFDFAADEVSTFAIAWEVALQRPKWRSIAGLDQRSNRQINPVAVAPALFYHPP